MGHGALPSNLRFYVYKVTATLYVIRDEARATAASSALSKILQGAMKFPSSKTKQGTDDLRQNNLQTAGDVEEFQVYRRHDVPDVQLAGDVKLDRKVWQEEGTSRVELGVGGGVVGQGSRGNKEAADEVEVMTKARGSVFNSSKEGGVTEDGAITGEKEGEIGGEGLLALGIRGMEEFGKWSPRWKRREDFGIKEVEEFARGFHNLGI